jgi:putative transposase
VVRYVRKVRLRQPRVGTRKLHYLLQGQDDAWLKVGLDQVMPVAPEQVWVADITYLPAKSGPLYLSLVTDAYSRKIVGHHLHQGLHAKLVAMAFRKG